MEEKLILERYGVNRPMTFRLASYCENDNLYVGLITHEEGYPERWSDLTVNLSVRCNENTAYIDTNNNGEEILCWLMENKLGRLTGKERQSGWCLYPEFEFDIEELLKYTSEDIRKNK